MKHTARPSAAEPALTALCIGAPDRASVTAAAWCWLEEQRGRLRQSFIAGGSAQSLLAEHSAAIDALLRALVACGQEKPAMALVAVGGYGRGELFPYSDLDLLFLHEGDGDEETGRLAESVLYVLWDLGLKVGQAHRSIEETLRAAQEDITIATTLLDARFIAGKREIFDDFAARFAASRTESRIAAFVDAKLAERNQRHLRWGDSRYMLEPNVKEGKGGLRDLHTLWWMAHYAYPIAAVKDLVGMGWLSPEEYRAFDKARQFLWEVRIHLHYLAGRAEERLTFDRQQAVAIALGYGDPSPNKAIEQFMRRYFAAVRTVGGITRIFCALLEEEKKGRPRAPWAWQWYAPWVLNGFSLSGQRLDVYSDEAFEENPLSMLELFRVAQTHDLDIHPRALRLVARSLTRIDGAMRSDPQANALFLDMLLSPKGAEATLRRMSEAGVLGRFIPDFGRVIGQTQFNGYHAYTVDEHTLVALGILHQIERGDLRKEFPLASGITPRIAMRRVLHLALFCHDIAKGRGGDHSQAGERVASRLAHRLGFSPEESRTCAWLVRHHLLFSHTAFKRDLDDPKTIEDFVALVQTSERLKLLLALTVADIRAVGPNVWNVWKGGLMRELYGRAEQRIGGGSSIGIAPRHPRWFRQDVHRLLPDWTESEVEAYLAQVHPGFLAHDDPARHAAMAHMLRRVEQENMPLAMETHHDRKRGLSEITLCTRNQPGLFSKLAGALSLSGANIINARICTLKSGLAIDSFHVQDMAGQLFDQPRRLKKLALHIEQALSGVLDLRAALAPKAHYLHASRNALRVPGQVFIDNDASDIYSVIEVSGHDRSGFLHAVTHALAELGLAIVTAHISTYGAQAADVFYVKDGFGMKITHEAKIRQVRERLLKAVAGTE